MNLPLTNTTIVVTRPLPQAQQTQAKLTQLGARVLSCPTLEITYPDEEKTTLALFKQINQFDHAIFISANAVKYALHYLDSDPTPLKQLTLWSIGKQTQAALQQTGLGSHSPAQGFTSEDLLQLPALQQVKGERFLLIRGQGGRALLADTFQQRGAILEHAIVYQRKRPTHCAFTPEQLSYAIDIVCVTSVESLNNLITLWSHPIPLITIPLVAGSQRIARYAKQCGFQQVIIAQDPSDKAMTHALLNWKRNNPND